MPYQNQLPQDLQLHFVWSTCTCVLSYPANGLHNYRQTNFITRQKSAVPKHFWIFCCWFFFFLESVVLHRLIPADVLPDGWASHKTKTEYWGYVFIDTNSNMFNVSKTTFCCQYPLVKARVGLLKSCNAVSDRNVWMISPANR